MATNLLDTVKQALPPDFADEAGSLLGEPGATTGSALAMLIPAALAMLVQKGSSSTGAQTVMAMLDHPGVDTAALGNLGSLFGGGGTQATALIGQGSSMASSLFGDKESALASTLAASAGMRSPQSASSLVALVVPIVLGVIKRFVASSGTGVSGLATLLAAQGPALQGALDSRLRSAMGFASPAAMLGPLATRAAEATQATAMAAARSSGAPDAAVDGSSSSIGRWWPWILAAIVVLFLLSRCMGADKAVQRSADSTPVPPPVSSPTPGPTPAPAPVTAPDNAAPAMPTALPAKVYFDVGQTALSDSGKSVAAAVADLVKKDGGKVDITGYADSSGNPAQNAELAKNRALAVRDVLIANGVPEASVAMKPPASFSGSGGDAEARRVEVTKAQ